MSTRHPVHDKLKVCSVFRNFEDDELAALLELAEPTVFAAGQAIVRQGEVENAMYLIAEGSADVILHAVGSADVRLCTLHAGEFFGELVLVDHDPRSADVSAAEDCTAMRISVGLMQRFAAESPVAAFKLNMAVLEILGRRLRESNSRYTESLAIISALSEEGTVMNPAEDSSGEKIVA